MSKTNSGKRARNRHLAQKREIQYAYGPRYFRPEDGRYVASWVLRPAIPPAEPTNPIHKKTRKV